MFPATLHLLPIKDLKDLSVSFGVGVSIDMQDLKDLKRCFSRERSRGTGPRDTGPEGVLSPCAVRDQAIPKLQSPPPNLANLGNPENPAPNSAPLLFQTLSLR